MQSSEYFGLKSAAQIKVLPPNTTHSIVFVCTVHHAMADIYGTVHVKGSSVLQLKYLENWQVYQ